MARFRRGSVAVMVGVFLVGAACGEGSTGGGSELAAGGTAAPPGGAGAGTPIPSGGASAGSAPTGGTSAGTAVPSDGATSGTPTATPSPAGSGAPAAPAELPRGGRSIFPEFRIVAYYGSSAGPALGVLGKGSAAQAAKAVERTARAWAGFDRPVLPMMELITTVAQGSAGKDGDYASEGDPEAVQEYLDVAHREKMLLVLDFQPGRGEFLPQVRRFEKFLLDPSVGVALDPEWKVGPDEKPAQVIGEASAADINEVSAYVADLVAKNDLPEKLFVIHQFSDRMLPDREKIKVRKGLATVLHADGNGSPAVKRTVYKQLAFPKPFNAGFKLFYEKDTRLMKPAEVMRLRPQPELITYQ